MKQEFQDGTKLLAWALRLAIVTALLSCTMWAQTSYEAEGSGNTLSGQATVMSCSGCSGGKNVGYIGNSSSNYLIMNSIQATSSGSATITVYYCVSGTRSVYVSVNGGAGTEYTWSGTSWTTPVAASITVTLQAGSNTLKFYNSSAWAPDIDRIVVAGGGSGYGLLPNGLRDKYKWPFDSASLWNTSIGSGAVYQAAGITSNNGGGYTTYFHPDSDVVIMAPTAPQTSLYYNGVGWNGGNRCMSQGSLLDTVPVPANYVLANSGDNNSTAILRSDARTIEQNQPFTRCNASGIATTLVTFSDVDIYGTDPSGAHGGSGLSALGGTIRYGEFTFGKIQHPMKVELWAQQYYHCCAYHWPATTVDGYANSSTYGGTNPNFGPGSLLVLLPSFNVNSLTTTPGKILAQAFKDYGAYAVDDVSSNGWGLIIEQGPNGRVLDEFSGLYGYSMDQPAAGSAFMNDLVTIFQALQIVTNNSSTNIGGGGTRRQPAPPALGN